MERCLDCNSVLSREEKVCVGCGTKVRPDETNFAALIASLVSILFYLSIAALIASPFVDRAPSFMFCLLISCALLFVMRTAKDSAQKIKRR
jgi:hypothetical protein